MEIRLRHTGVVITDAEFRAAHPATSFPAVLDAAVLDAFGADPVLAGPPPAAGPYETAVRDGVARDALGNWVEAWRIEPWPAERIAQHEREQRAILLVTIDASADAARTRLVGDALRAVEYQRAGDEAAAFAAAGYASTVPPTVQSWAEAKGWSAQAAADDILATAQAWNAALYAVRDLRLKAKEAVRTAADLASAQAAAAPAIAQLHAIGS